MEMGGCCNVDGCITLNARTDASYRAQQRRLHVRARTAAVGQR